MKAELIILGTLIIAGLFVWRIQPEMWYVDRPVGEGAVKECTDGGGEFWAVKNYGELEAKCTYPSKTVNL